MNQDPFFVGFVVGVFIVVFFWISCFYLPFVEHWLEKHYPDLK